MFGHLDLVVLGMALMAFSSVLGFVALGNGRRTRPVRQAAPPPVPQEDFGRSDIAGMAGELLPSLYSYVAVLSTRAKDLPMIAHHSDQLTDELVRLLDYARSRIDDNPADALYHMVRVSFRAVTWHMFLNMAGRNRAGSRLVSGLAMELERLRNEDQNSVSCAWLFGFRDTHSDVTNRIAAELRKSLPRLNSSLDTASNSAWPRSGQRDLQEEFRLLAKARQTVAEAQDKALLLRNIC